jgi:CysZ protein
MKILRDFSQGLGAHLAGIRFVFGHTSYLPLLLVPFCLTLLLYSAGFYVFTLYDDQLLKAIWDPATTEASGLMATLHWLFVHLLKMILYVLLFAVMYFGFMVVANILASPLYDYIAGRIGRHESHAALRPGPESEIGIPRIVLEELKKACFVLLLPLLFFFVPVIGAPLSLVFAMLLLAWDFLDFSLSRDEPRFGPRLRYVRQHPFMLLGFGLPLLVPFLHILLYPFAIVGSSLLYQKRLLAEKAQAEGRP